MVEEPCNIILVVGSLHEKSVTRVALLPLKPEIILMDEPCSALDPIATAQIEELIDESIIAINSSGKGLLPAPSLFIYFLSIIAAAISRKNLSID